MFPPFHLPQSGLLRKLADVARKRKSVTLTLVAAAVLVPACIGMLLEAGRARIWVEPVVAAILTTTLLGLIWEFYWKRSVAEEVFQRFHPQVQVNDTFSIGGRAAGLPSIPRPIASTFRAPRTRW